MAITDSALNTGSAGWTRQSIQDISVLFYTKRGTKNTSANKYQIFNGANLTVTYTE